MSSRPRRLAALALPLAALAVAATPASASPTASENHLLTQFAPDGSASVTDCAVAPTVPVCGLTDGFGYDITGPRGGRVAPGRELLGTLARRTGQAGISKASVLIAGPDELRAGDPRPFTGTDAALATRFFDAVAPRGSYVDAVYARHGSRPGASDGTGARLQVAGHAERRTTLLGSPEQPLRERSSITEVAAVCENATGRCAPVAIDSARRLSADPRAARPGSTHVYMITALKLREERSASRAATGGASAQSGSSYVAGPFKTRLRRIPSTLTCAQAREGVNFGVRFSKANRSRVSGFVKLLSTAGSAQFNSQPFRGAEESAGFNYRARTGEQLCGRTIRAVYSVRQRDAAGRFSKAQRKTYRVTVQQP